MLGDAQHKALPITDIGSLPAGAFPGGRRGRSWDKSSVGQHTFNGLAEQSAGRRSSLCKQISRVILMI
jgi:hypothetical protein